MKNLFKSLMLVAVAAMAFTACQKDNEETNKTEQKTVITGVATIENDDTRSGFGDKVGTAYPSQWDGNEDITVFYNGTAYDSKITDDKGHFSVEVDGTLPEVAFITICSPKAAWDGSENYCTVPTEQTPLANSVAPAAHILRAQSVQVNNGSAMAQMQHAVAYGKMTVNTPAEFEISRVELSMTGVDGWSTTQTYTYTLINDGSVEGNTFWFAANMLNVSEFTITAYDAENNAYTKTVEVAADKLKFQIGHVSTFSVSELKAVEVTYPVFTSAIWENPSSSDKKIILTGADSLKMILNFSECNYESYIDEGTYTIEKGATGPGKIYGGHSVGWAWYTDADGNGYGLLGGEVVVDIIGGKYDFQMKDIQLCDAFENIVETLPYARFTGDITNATIPDYRTKLATPSNVQTSVSGKTITLTWDAVANADGYRVKMYSPNDESIDEVVTETQYVFNAQKSLQKYYFVLSAYAKDDNEKFKTSDEVYPEATTEDTDPKMELSKETVNFDADGGDNTIEVTLKNYTAEITFTKTGDWFEVDLDGNVLTVSAPAYDSESPREGSITITAGDISKEVTVKQKKAASAGSGDGSEANPYTFSAVKVSGFFLCFEDATNGAYLQLDRQNSDVREIAKKGENCKLNDTAVIYAGSGNIYTLNGTQYGYAQYAPYSTITVIEHGNAVYTCNLKMSINGDEPIYYTYTGNIEGQNQ